MPQAAVWMSSPPKGEAMEDLTEHITIRARVTSPPKGEATDSSEDVSQPLAVEAKYILLKIEMRKVLEILNENFFQDADKVRMVRAFIAKAINDI
jgi:phage tail tube protein FII